MQGQAGDKAARDAVISNGMAPTQGRERWGRRGVLMGLAATVGMAGCAPAVLRGRGGVDAGRDPFAGSAHEPESLQGWGNAPATMPPSAGVRPMMLDGMPHPGRVGMRLTYDDGPHPVHTPMVLDLLARHGAYATFFVQGQNVARYPGLVARMVREGHAVGNHTYTHPSMPDRTVEERRVEWAATQDAVQAAAGVRPVLWRPPYGATNPLVKEEAFVLFGLHQVLWERDTFDYLNPSPRVVADRVRATPVGAKVLLHDVHAGTVVATALFLSELAPLSF